MLLVEKVIPKSDSLRKYKQEKKLPNISRGTKVQLQLSSHSPPTPSPLSLHFPLNSPQYLPTFPTLSRLSPLSPHFPHSLPTFPTRSTLSPYSILTVSLLLCLKRTNTKRPFFVEKNYKNNRNLCTMLHKM